MVNDSAANIPTVLLFVVENALPLATVLGILSLLVGVAGLSMVLHRNGELTPSARRRTHIDQKVDEYSHA